MNTLKSVVKSIPPLHKLAKSVKKLDRSVKNKLVEQLKDKKTRNRFYTLSPDVLVALVKAFNLQKQSATGGSNLLEGHAYYEFGMYKGFSFWFAEQIAREYTDSTFQFLGFDSFEGLPQPQLEVEARAFQEGDYKGTYEVVTGNLRRWKADLSRIKLYKGFYSDDLFAQLRRTEQFPMISICLIDVDLYESCVPVLNFIKEYLVEGSILLFDDYNQKAKDDNSGERRALIEFESQNPSFKKQHLFDYGREGVAYRVVSL